MPTIGININDSTQNFTDQILNGEKTIETRNTNTLHPYIGRRVGIVKTGKGPATLVGYVTIGTPIFYDTVDKFRNDYNKHKVNVSSKFDIPPTGKWGYPLIDVERVTPRVLTSRGIVARKL